MPLYDVTLPLRDGMPVFPGDPPFKMEPVFQVEKGDRFNLSLITMGSHVGTHVDPPSHYIHGGSTVDLIPLETLVGDGIILDMTGRDRIDSDALEKSHMGHHTRILFKTDNSFRLTEQHFREDFVHLTAHGAEYLTEKRVILVGIDGMSIEQFNSPGAVVHRELLRAGVLILEGLNLLDVPPGPCEIFCLPLRIQGGDGAPARVLVRM